MLAPAGAGLSGWAPGPPSEALTREVGLRAGKGGLWEGRTHSQVPGGQAVALSTEALWVNVHFMVLPQPWTTGPQDSECPGKLSFWAPTKGHTNVFYYLACVCCHELGGPRSYGWLHGTHEMWSNGKRVFPFLPGVGGHRCKEHCFRL